MESGAAQFPELSGILGDLAHFIEIASSQPELGGDSENEKERAKVLLSYYARLFEIPGITKESIETLRLVREKKYSMLAMLGTRQSLKIRQSWSSGSIGAWSPSEPFQQSVMQELSGFWKQPVVDLKEAVLKLIRAAALYRPIEKPLRSVADRDGWGDFWHDIAKPTLMVISAVKTFGVSLALKAGMSYMKEKKDQERFEAFAAGVSEAIVAAESAISGSQAAIESERGLQARVAEGFQTQMINMLLSDYSRVQAGQRENFVVGLLTGLGLDASGIKSLRPRGIVPITSVAPAPENQNRDESVNPRLIATVLIAVLLLAGIMVMLFVLLTR